MSASDPNFDSGETIEESHLDQKRGRRIKESVQRRATTMVSILSILQKSN